MKTLSTKLNEQEINQIKQLCSEQASTPSQFIRWLIQKHLIEKQKANQ